MTETNKNKGLRVKSASPPTEIQGEEGIRKRIQTKKRELYNEAAEIVKLLKGPEEELLAQINSDLSQYSHNEYDEYDIHIWLEALITSVNENKAEYFGQDFDFLRLLLAVCNGMSLGVYLIHGYRGTTLTPPAVDVYSTIETLCKPHIPANRVVDTRS